MKILFVNLSALKFTTSTPDLAPLGGSESAVCYLARALAQRGHAISLIANLPEGVPESSINNVEHYPIKILQNQAFFSAQSFQHIVVSNAPAACAPLKAMAPAARILFWAHALPDQPAMHFLTHSQTKMAIDDIVFVSQWQSREVEQAFGRFPRAFVIGNGVSPAFESMFSSPNDLLRAKQNRAAYTTTPYRGLSVLLKAMQGIDRVTTLDIFSSMRVYQAVDDVYAPLFLEASRNSCVTNHGSVRQAELARHLRATAFLWYPSIYPETFCITAAEAMAAGLKVVSTNLGALEETTGKFADLVPITTSDGDVLVQDFRSAMRRAVDAFTSDPHAWADERFEQMKKINQTCLWAKRAEEWEELLSGP